MSKDRVKSEEEEESSKRLKNFVILISDTYKEFQAILLWSLQMLHLMALY